MAPFTMARGRVWSMPSLCLGVELVEKNLSFFSRGTEAHMSAEGTNIDSIVH